MCAIGFSFAPEEFMRVDFGRGLAEAQKTMTPRVLPEYTCHARKHDPSAPLTYDDLDHPDCDNDLLCKSHQTHEVVIYVFAFVLLVIAIICFVKYWRSEKALISIGVKPSAGKGTPGSTNPFAGKSPFCEH